MLQFTGLERRQLLLSSNFFCYHFISPLSLSIVGISSQLSRSYQGVVTDAELTKLMMYQWRRQKIVASVAGT